MNGLIDGSMDDQELDLMEEKQDLFIPEIGLTNQLSTCKRLTGNSWLRQQTVD